MTVFVDLGCLSWVVLLSLLSITSSKQNLASLPEVPRAGGRCCRGGRDIS